VRGAHSKNLWYFGLSALRAQSISASQLLFLIINLEWDIKDINKTFRLGRQMRVSLYIYIKPRAYTERYLGMVTMPCFYLEHSVQYLGTVMIDLCLKGILTSVADP
jgi:hypothetical protein